MDNKKILVILHTTTDMSLLLNDLTKFFPKVDILFMDAKGVNESTDIREYSMVLINYDTQNLIHPELVEFIIKNKASNLIHMLYYRKFDTMYQIYRLSALKRTIINNKLIGADIDQGINITNKLIKSFKNES